MIRRLLLLAASAAALVIFSPGTSSSNGERHFLYVAEPGIRNYVEYGGVGVIVYDMDNGHKFVRRIPTFAEVPGKAPENVKGVVASAKTGRLYVSTIKRVAAIDLATDRLLWNKEYEGGADRLAISPDGKLLYIPSLEGPHWNAVDAASGDGVWQKRIGGAFAASPIYGDGRIYFCDQEGETTIIKPGRKFEQLATNSLDDGCMASPAVDGKALILRTKSHLYRIENGTPTEH